MPIDWSKFDGATPASSTPPSNKGIDWSKFDAPKQEAHPTLSKVLSLAKGVDEAFLGIPHEIATGVRAATHLQTFKQAREDIDRATKQATEQHPYYHAGGVIGGALATLPLMPEAAPTWGGRALQSGAIGSGMSGVSEFTDSHDLNKAGKSAVVGGVIGTAASPVLEVAGKIASGVVSPFVHAAFPEQQAQRVVADALKQDTKVGGQGLTPSEWQAAKQEGSPVVVADLGGEKTRNLARTSANFSDEGRQALKNITETRFDTQGDRYKDAITRSGISNFEKAEKLKEIAKQQNKPLYDKAYAYSDAMGGEWSDKLAGLMQSSDFKSAIAGADRRASNEAAVTGNKAVKNPFKLDAEGNYVLNVGKDGSTATPNLRFWDVVKQNLDDMIGQTKRAGGDIKQLKDLKTTLVSELDRLNPHYKSARGSAQSFFNADDAIEAGANFFKDTSSEIAKSRSVVAKMNPAERQLFRDGFATSLADKIDSIGDRRDVANLFRNERFRQKIETALGKGQADRLEAQTHVETVMQQLKNGVAGNSTTAQQLISAGLFGGGALLQGQDVSTSGLVAAIAAGGKRFANQRVAEQVVKLLSSQNPNDVTKVVKMATGSKSVMDTLRQLNVFVSSQAGGRGGKEYGSKLGVIDISR